MSNKLDKSLIINAIKLHYNYKKDTDFASFLGIKPTTLSSWYARNTFDFDLIYAKCKDINPDWLLTGKGEMLRSSKVEEPPPVVPQCGLCAVKDQLIASQQETIKSQQEAIKSQRELIATINAYQSNPLKKPEPQLK